MSNSTVKEVREARRAHSSKREIILALLQEAGGRGVTNVRLNEICFRYGARIFELRRQGFVIERKLEGVGVYRFTLRGSGQMEMFAA